MKERTLFIDGDGCNAIARDLATRLTLRGCRVVVVANRIVTSDTLVTVQDEVLQRDVYVSQNHVRYVVVDTKEDAADTFMIDHAINGDLVITRDLLLAKHLLEHHVVVISDYGEVYNKETISARMVRAETASAIRQTDDVSLKSIRAMKKKKVHAKAMQKFSLLLDRWRQGNLFS